MPEYISRKFWREVEERLDDPKSPTYYVGGTLSLSLSKNRAIGLNLDGTGFIMNKYTLKNRGFNDRVYQPTYIQEKVLKFYINHKGYTTHFSQEFDKRNKKIAAGGI